MTQYPVAAVGDPVAAPQAQAVGIPVAAVGDPVPQGESWGQAGCGTKIGGSLESNVALEDVIQPFASRRLAWLHREASVASAATRILYGD